MVWWCACMYQPVVRVPVPVDGGQADADAVVRVVVGHEAVVLQVDAVVVVAVVLLDNPPSITSSSHKPGQGWRAG